MAISVSCDCGKQLRVKDDLAGKKIRCPECQAVLRVGPAPAMPPPPIDREEAVVAPKVPKPVPVAVGRADKPAAARALGKPPPKKSSRLVLWLAIGGVAALLLLGAAAGVIAYATGLLGGSSASLVKKG